MKTGNTRNMSRRHFVRNTAAALAAASACRYSDVFAQDTAEEAWTMNLATSSVMFGKLPFDQVCQRVSRLGLQAVDIWAPFGGQCAHLDDIKNSLGGKRVWAEMTRTSENGYICNNKSLVFVQQAVDLYDRDPTKKKTAVRSMDGERALFTSVGL